MQDALKSAAELVLGEEEAKKYVISVTEKEIQMGLLSVDTAGVEGGCAWFRRNIKDIDSVEPSYQLSRYMECLGNEETVKLAQGLLTDLKDRKMQHHLPSDNLLAYSVPWTDKGINPELLEHQKYLKQMSEDFVQKMMDMITKGIKERSVTDSSDPVEAECLQHVRFCQQKCKNFHGREVTLEEIKAYLTNDSKSPLVVHGQSGCGKTSILAKVAALVPSSYEQTPCKPAVITRFIGTTPDSSNIISLLTSIIRQIYALLNTQTDIPEDIKLLVKAFKSALHLVKPTRPLVIILDSLDQLDPANNSRSLNWLPASLPDTVKVIVSTLEDDVYECFPSLKRKLKKMPKHLVPVPVLDKEDVNSIIDSWLHANKRTLTTGQRDTLTDAFDTCPIPLFLKLSFDQACKWNSFSPPEDVRLQSTIRDSIDLLFSQLEVKHGQILVSNALGYLTTATNGLSESELEDILSCDDVVLNDVYVYWTPPVRRLPPLLLVRLRTDLQEYVVERGADGIRVMYWYHRQFIEAATARYCGVKVIQNLHQGLAEFFSGKWSNGNKKPCTDRSGKDGLEDRHSAAQPLRYGDNYNLRKLNNLPFHLTMARNLEDLKNQCLLHLDFLQAKLLASSLRSVVSDYQLAKKEFPEDNAIATLQECLQLSKQALVYDPHQLALQLLDRLTGFQDEELVGLCEQCKNISIPYLLPDQEILVKPGGQLVYLLSDHTAEVTGLDISRDGKTIVTCADDEEQSVKLWNLGDGTLIKSFNKLGKTPLRVRYMASDSLILAEYEGELLKAISLSGEVVYSLNNCPQYWVGGHEKNILTVLDHQAAILYDAFTGKKKSKVKTKNVDCGMTEGEENLIHGSGRYIVVTEASLYKVSLLDLEKEKFSDWITVFKPPPDDAVDEPTLSVDMVCVSPDERCFVVSCIIDSDFIFFSTDTLQQTRVIKGNSDDVGQCLHFTLDSKQLFFTNHQNVIVYDLETEVRREILPHLSAIVNVTCTTWKILITLSEEDNAVRVWDITRPEKQTIAGKTLLGTSVSCYCALPNPRYVAMVVRTKNEDYKVGAVLVYDLVTRKIVRRGALVDGLPKAMHCIGDTEVILATDTRKLKVFDLDTMTVTRVFEGKLCRYGQKLEIIKDGKEILTLMQEKHGFKTYNIETGKTVSLLHAPSEVRESKYNKFDQHSLIVNKTNLMACHIDDEGPIVIFDYLQNVCLHVLKLTSRNNTLWAAYLPQDSSYLAIHTYKSFPDPTIQGKMNPVSCIGVHNIEQGKITHWCMDQDYYRMYRTQGVLKDQDTDVDKAMLLDDDRLVTSSNDFFLRVWNIKTGELIKRLEGHTVLAELVQNHDKSPYFVSFGNCGEENSLRIWDKETLACVATYRLDHKIQSVEFSVDGQSLVSIMHDCSVILWTLVIPGTSTQSTTLTSRPLTFQGQGEHLCLSHSDIE
ncbi:NACHT and WD repeat domain-containing protein 1 [Mizuhopecten yessoensis]|uniref:NACHT and WD repeat domain-containing protein 1 n=1 Tax=Mizuhopecten yessoensis TaxID=6573 RepID=A0A210R6X6_MIZYE|nr:NACHT and WD repeat domain-containing protein 1 [Mizuhopecten yessoensis]